MRKLAIQIRESRKGLIEISCRQAKGQGTPKERELARSVAGLIPEVLKMVYRDWSGPILIGEE